MEVPPKPRTNVAGDLYDRGRRAGYIELLRRPSYLRLFTGQLLSSFGDWVGLIAILAIGKRLYDNEFLVAALLLARLGPAFLFGPIAGVIVDRWNRKTVLVACDAGRAALVLVLVFVEPIGRAIPLLNPAVLLFVISAALEMLTLLWQPAKDASVPTLVERHQLTHAYSLLLIAAYATFPLSGAVFGVLANASQWLWQALNLEVIRPSQEHLALMLDAGTFLMSASLMLTLAIPRNPRQKRVLDVRAVLMDLSDGLTFIRRHPMIMPWAVGIGGAFAGVGIFISTALFFVDKVLGGGAPSYGLLITAVGTGLGAGFVIAGVASRVVQKDVLFSGMVLAMGASLIVFASVNTLSSGVFMGAVCGFFAGIAYPSGYALVLERVGPEKRGRTSGAITSMIRIAIVGASALAPVVARVIDQVLTKDFFIIAGRTVDLRGSRVVMWLGGALVFGAGLVTTNAIRVRVRSLRMTTPGIFFVFEGGEGTGKSTQIELLHQWLRSQGREVLVTREPGGTEIGKGIRNILLDPNSAGLSDKAEALLYAADRAQHVHTVIRPALEKGLIVVSDRYLDSSVAYQGLARGLGFDQVRDLNRWATEGLVPDLVFLLELEPRRGLERSGMDDRLEQEGLEFHEKVREAYRMLAERFPERFIVIDASQPPDAVAREIQNRVVPYLERVAHRDVEAMRSKAVAT